MKKFVKALKYVGLCFVFVIAAFSCFAIYKFISISSQVKFEADKLTVANTKLNIYDCNNELVNNTSVLGNQVVTLSSLPDYVKDAFISIEDKQFYTHNGLNYKRIVKAMITNLTSKELKQGASTISQQLIKNTHLSSDKTFDRKIKEMMLATQLEKEFSKDEILETYLNVIYFGNSAYGIENASNVYFNKSANNLSLNESAGLAGLIKSPYYYSPIYNYDNFIKRKNLVLKNMLTDGKISEAQYDHCLNEKIAISENSNIEKCIYENACIEEACNILKISEKELAVMGLKINTNYNPQKQEIIKKTITNECYYPANRNGYESDGCVVNINAKTGAVTGFYGTGNFSHYKFKRQPGSALKPVLVYAPAFEKNIITQKTKIQNTPINFDGYSPQNISDQNKEYVSVEESLEKSLNIPAVKLLDYVGIDYAKQMATNCGIDFSTQDNNYAIALGGLTNGVNIINLAGSYTPFVNSGKYLAPYFVESIQTKNGKVIYKHFSTDKQVMRDDTAFLVSDLMKKATKNGTSKRLSSFSFDVAGKTGTVGVPNTNFNTDAWSIAYTSNDITCSWLGNSDGQNESTLDGSNNGGTNATSIIKEIYENFYKTTKPANFSVPNSVKEVNIDAIMYENENQIVEADSTLSERYKLSAYFSVNNLPEEKLNTSTNFDVENLNSNIAISYSALPQNSYKLYRISNNKRELLRTTVNTYSKISLSDNITYNTEFYYELETLDKNQKVNNIEQSDKFFIQQKRWFF